MFKLKIFLFLSLGAVLSECSSTGFDRANMAKELRQAGTPVTDAEIARVLALKPQLRRPFRLGVYLDSAYSRYSRYSSDQRNFELTEKKQLLANLKGNGDIVAEAFLISNGDITASGAVVTLKDIRLAAARYHGDAVLILQSTSNTDTYPNFLSILYFSIVGFWIAPGSHCDAIHMVHGAMYDVRNGYFYIDAESDATDRVIRPLALRECSVPLNQARKKAMASFSAEFHERLKTLK